MWGRKKELGIIVRVELKNDKIEQVATHIQAFSLDFPMPTCSVILLGKELSFSSKVSLCIIPRIHFTVLSVFPDTGYIH